MEAKSGKVRYPAALNCVAAASSLISVSGRTGSSGPNQRALNLVQVAMWAFFALAVDCAVKSLASSSSRVGLSDSRSGAVGNLPLTECRTVGCVRCGF